MSDGKVRLERNALASNDQCTSRHVLEFNAHCRGLARPRLDHTRASRSGGGDDRPRSGAPTRWGKHSGPSWQYRRFSTVANPMRIPVDRTGVASVSEGRTYCAA